MSAIVWAGAVASVGWLLGWVLPFRPFQIRESLAAPGSQAGNLDSITALIPARNEAQTLGRTLDGLAAQSPDIRVIVVDDQSQDDTASVARSHQLSPELVSGSPPPADWLGKMWALHQGLPRVRTPFVLLIDADIELRPGVLAALLSTAEAAEITAASLMAELRRESFWEKLLAPAYVYFFRLLYPFSLVRSDSSRIAGAAGGCILIRTEALRAIGGFAALRTAIIDDCTLARLLKRAGGRLWLGMTRDVRSLRPYQRLSDFGDLVARSAYAQLNFSTVQLSACTVAMIALFVGPPILAMSAIPATAGWLGAAGSVAMFASYVPVLRYYGCSVVLCITLPLVAAGYLLMTWHSAIRYWTGTRTVWKGRIYSTSENLD